MNSFAIEKGIPVPPEKDTKKYPFKEMQIGDSFFIPGAKTSAVISGPITYRKTRYREQYMCRCVDGGLRVWRTG